MNPPNSANPEVIDAARVAAVEPQPGFLHGVIGLGDRSEHAVGDAAPIPSVPLELFGQPILPHRRNTGPIGEL